MGSYPFGTRSYQFQQNRSPSPKGEGGVRSKNTLYRRGERKKMISLDHFSEAARLRAGNLPIFPLSCLSLLIFENNLLRSLDLLSEQGQTPPLSGGGWEEVEQLTFITLIRA